MIPIVKVLTPNMDALSSKILEVFETGNIGEGFYVYEFEQSFANTFSLDNVIAVSSGTAALHLALILSGVNEGDEVITTPITAEPTNLSICYQRAKPIFADVNPVTGNICPSSVESLITNKTKAIIAVHYAGYPAEIMKLRNIADRFNLALIEDCAHALGARVADSPIGSVGDYSIFSFQAIKHMTTVDGGVLIVKDKNKVERAKKLRWFGMQKGLDRSLQNITEVGYKYNMSNVSAAIGLLQLENIVSVITSHIENANYFNRKFSEIPSIKIAEVDETTRPSYWLYTLRAERSDDLINYLVSNGVMASKLHIPNTYHDIFVTKTELPNARDFYRELVHIPVGWWLTPSDRNYISDLVKNFYDEHF